MADGLFPLHPRGCVGCKVLRFVVSTPAGQLVRPELEGRPHDLEFFGRLGQFGELGHDLSTPTMQARLDRPFRQSESGGDRSNALVLPIMQFEHVLGIVRQGPQRRQHALADLALQPRSFLPHIRDVVAQVAPIRSPLATALVAKLLEQLLVGDREDERGKARLTTKTLDSLDAAQKRRLGQLFPITMVVSAEEAGNPVIMTPKQDRASPSITAAPREQQHLVIGLLMLGHTRSGAPRIESATPYSLPRSILGATRHAIRGHAVTPRAPQPGWI